MHRTTRPLTLTANVSFCLVQTTGGVSELTDAVKFPRAPAISVREPKMGSYRWNCPSVFFLTVWFLMLSQVPRCFWPLGKWKRKEEAGQQHDRRVYGCCGLNTCENSGMRRWWISIWGSASLFLKNKSHCVFPHTIAHHRLELKLFHPTFATECHMLRSSADFLSLASRISQDHALCWR